MLLCWYKFVKSTGPTNIVVQETMPLQQETRIPPENRSSHMLSKRPHPTLGYHIPHPLHQFSKIAADMFVVERNV